MVQSNRRVTSLFGSSDEDEPPSPIKSHKPSSAYSVRDGDDGVSNRVKDIVVPLYNWVQLRGVLTVNCLLLPLRESRGFFQNGYLLAFLGRLLLTPNFIL